MIKKGYLHNTKRNKTITDIQKVCLSYKKLGCRTESARSSYYLECSFA